MVGLPRESTKLSRWHIIIFIHWPLKLKLGLPSEGFSFHDFEVDKILNDISAVHIDCDNVNNFHSFQYIKWFSDFSN